MSAGHGFTLIELAVVLAITAVLAGSVVLSFRAAERRALQDASLMLQADLRYTQRMAMIEGRRWGILFDVVENQYFVYSTNPTEVEKTVAIPHGVMLVETSAPDMEYLPRGTGSHGFRVTLAKGRYWQRLTATVSGGRIAIKEMQWVTDSEDIPLNGTE